MALGAVLGAGGVLKGKKELFGHLLSTCWEHFAVLGGM